MIRKILLSFVFIILIYGFWISPQFNEIMAGVAIFLLGMMNLQEGFKAFSGGILENILKKTTDKLWKSLSFGIFSTALMQSSTLISLITISFLSAGLISLSAGIGIIFGANLGTTTGAWLIAAFGLKVNIASYAMPMLVFGVILLFQKSKVLKGIAYVLIGTGFIFLGIHYMKEGFDTFKDRFDLSAYAMSGYQGVLLFTLVGILVTVVMQSSHATLVLIITALAAHQVSYENALALAIGANLGTAVTSMIGALGANIDGRRLVAAHLIFNLVTASLAIIFIFQLTYFVDWLSRLLTISPDNYTLKLAVFHSIFNGLGIVIMLPLMEKLQSFLIFILPEKVGNAAQVRYLHKSLIELPENVIEAVRKETIHLYDNAFDVISGSLQLKPDELRGNYPLDKIIQENNSIELINVEEEYIQTIKVLYSHIVEFISVALPKMDSRQANELFIYREAGHNIVEAIKDTKHLQKNLAQYHKVINPNFRNEYQQLRHNLALFLRELDSIKTRGDDMSSILLLDNLRLSMKENDTALNQRLELAIRERKISSNQAISLMNDSSYVYEVSKRLVKMAEVLFASRNDEMNEAEHLLQLEDDELNKLLRKDL